MRDFLFGHTRVWARDLWISSPALYHCAMVTTGFHFWQFQVFNSGAEGLMVVLFWLDLWEIFFLATPGFEPGTLGSLVLHSTTVPHWLLVFTSNNFKYLSQVQREWWWYCFDWICERCRGTSGCLVQLYPCATLTTGIHLWQLFWLDWFDWTCERFSFWPHQGLNQGPLDL